MISLYIKNRPWNGQPRCDYIRIISATPLQIRGFRIDGANRLAEEAIGAEYLKRYNGWYHPATAWEIEEYKRLGGMV